MATRYRPDHELPIWNKEEEMTEKKAPPGLMVSVLIDESGSMQSHKMTAINAFNHYVEALTLASLPATVSAIAFGCGHVRKMMEQRPAFELPKLTGADYRPNGGTPLCRGMGETMTEMDSMVAKQKAIILLTDGSDCGGGQWSAAKIAKMVEQRTNDGWLFVFLGVGQLAFMYGPTFGMKLHQMIECNPNNLEQAMQIAAMATLRYQMEGAGTVFTDEEQAAAAGKSVDEYAAHIVATRELAMGYGIQKTV